jgi:hypothetical protein
MTSLAFIPDPRGLVYEKDETKDLFQKIDFSSRKANPR